MKSRLSSFVLALMLAGLCISQTSSQMMTPSIRRVADRLACKCGACNNTVATCQMLQCHYSLPAREKIARMQKAGMSDDQIVQNFVQEIGIAALAAPPAQGFNLLAWVMPFVGIALGLVAVTVYLKRFRRPAAAESAAEPPEIDDKYRKRIEKEMADLE